MQPRGLIREHGDAPLSAVTKSVWFVLLIILTIVIRGWNVGYAAPWWDELHSLVYVRNSASHLIDIQRITDIHPPFYFLTLKGWLALFGETRDAARYFSVVLGALCVAVIYLIGRQLFTARIALLAMAFVATFPTAVHYAREIRMYPLFTLLFLISFLFYLKMVQDLRQDNEPSRKARLWLVLFITTLTLTFYTHYTSALLFMLYAVFAGILLIRGDKRSFVWTVAGLAIATALTIPQVYHLVNSSLGDDRKSWMAPTTLPIFYSTTLGAFNYVPIAKLLIIFAMACGWVLMLLRDRETAILLFTFSVGGICLAALIGVVEPIYLVRTIQVFTFLPAFFIAYLIARLPIWPSVIAMIALVILNSATVARNEYLPQRALLHMEAMRPLIHMMNPEQDRVFSKGYLPVRRAAEFLHLDLFDHAKIITLEGFDSEQNMIEAEIEACLVTPNETCRSVIIMVELKSRFNKEAIDKWNAYLDTILRRFPHSTDFRGGGFRALVVSRNSDFLKRAQQILNGN